MSRPQETVLHQRGKFHLRRGLALAGHIEGLRIELPRLDGGNAFFGGFNVFVLPLDPDPVAMKAFCDRARRPASKERIEDHITRVARSEDHAIQQRLGLLRGMSLVAVFILHALSPGRQ
ncbi:MAG: hypothetical protein KPEEDBHJ_03456 [Anaerolineales bacterium]|nr:hypothetical protein [Anaerolineales bacterium]